MLFPLQLRSEVYMEPRYRSGADEIERLIIQIWRIRAAQTVMRRANRAVRRGDRTTLRRQGFSEQHIVSILAIHSHGQQPFPSSVFRNNSRAARFLIQELERRTTSIRAFVAATAPCQPLGDGVCFFES